MQRIGVSPAFVLSASGTGFTAEDYLPAIRRVADLGFSALQLEVFHPDAVMEWTPTTISRVRDLLEGENLLPSQFVAHFMLEDFRSVEALVRRGNFPAFRRFLEIAAAFPNCPVITVPMPAFDGGLARSPKGYRETHASLVDALGSLLELVGEVCKRLALEIMPHSLIGGAEGFLRLRQEAGLGALAYNFDTGHAWARKEAVELIPPLLGDSIAGTHLCDNRTHESLKLRPGVGSLDFGALLESLARSGYQGALDLEILCPAEAVEREYAAGLAFIEALRSPNRAAIA